ncbi:PAS domain-containing sensor histidine kinase [Croceicoccus hydrothermalis]|uniref:PAS domain-containing sensor histidine kinase n=1 Tax=Croceicoccus hydrothermalis TaxID=2867964 RepID=UPI001EFAF037|nr:PAS domain-containing protein [Croceicoccus hydrothermalis]
MIDFEHLTRSTGGNQKMHDQVATLESVLDEERSADMVERVRIHDWSPTSLGPVEDWPQSLRTAVDIMLGSGHAMCIAWGSERVFLYNDAYVPILGSRHPEALGLTFAQVWPEIWDKIEPLVDSTFAGKTNSFRDMPLSMTRNGYVEETFWTFSYSPIRDESGAVAGLLNVTMETTQNVIAERQRDAALAELRASEAFLSNVLGASTDCFKVLDLEGRLTFMSEGGQRVMEVSDFNAIAGCPWPDFWSGPGHKEARLAVESAGRGEPHSFIGQADTMGGTTKWWHVAVSPIRDENGEVDRILSVSRDITDLRASEEDRDRFVRLIENSTDFVGMAALDGKVFYVNDAARRMVGLEGADVTELVIADFFPSEQIEKVAQEVLPAVEREGHWEGELAFKHFGTGELIPVLYSVFPIVDANAALIGYGTVTRDHRERKRAEEDMRFMNGELAHRLKNVLAVVQSVAQQTLRGATDTASAAQSLGSRLTALGAATDVLTGSSWRSADLREVATGALAPHAEIGERITIDGPQVTLKPELTVAFALALHELATNAAKYGALSNETGKVTLEWTIEGSGEDAILTLIWREEGGPPVVPPERKGFGSALIDRSMRSYFGGKAETDYRPEGLVFELEARLTDAAVAARN